MGEIQRAIAPAELALKVMQSSNIFTVGGSLSANVHGRDLDLTQIVEVVEAERYYLTYQLYPTAEQLHRAYPNAVHTFERKRFYDPDELFSNQFYELYGHAQPE